MRVRILGGGVAGLAAAVALRQRGLDDVLVLERDTAAEMAARRGHGMMLMPNAVAALRALGAERCLDGQRALRQAVFQDEHGRVLQRESLDGAFCVTRRGLVDGLRAELPADAIEHGRRCARVVLDAAPAGALAAPASPACAPSASRAGRRCGQPTATCSSPRTGRARSCARR